MGYFLHTTFDGIITGRLLLLSTSTQAGHNTDFNLLYMEAFFFLSDWNIYHSTSLTEYLPSDTFSNKLALPPLDLFTCRHFSSANAVRGTIIQPAVPFSSTSRDLFQSPRRPSLGFLLRPLMFIGVPLRT